VADLVVVRCEALVSASPAGAPSAKAVVSWWAALGAVAFSP